MKDGPQMVTRRGAEMAVVIPVEEWRRVTATAPKKALKEILLAPEPRFDLDIPPRSELFAMRQPPDITNE